MLRFGMRAWGLVCLSAIGFAFHAGTARGATIDERGEIKLGLRTYVSARIGSEETDRVSNSTLRSETFPHSPAGHLRQNRYFVEAEFDHNLRRLVREGFGPLSLLNDLPFKVSDLKYHLVFRGEGEGIFDFGPREFRTATQGFPITSASGVQIDPRIVRKDRRRLRRLLVHRERLFQAFFDAQFGDLFIRFGRQILAWGETDAFRLLDNINPVDNSFGGFLISLDERRVPLDMLRANYYVGTLGPLSEIFVEGYAAVDKEVGWFPGANVHYSAWALPNLGAPSADVRTVYKRPPASISSARGGFQVKFNAPMPGLGDATFGVAHYYTYFDTPGLENRVLRGPIPGVPEIYPDTDPDGAGFPDDIDRPVGGRVKAIQSPPRTQVTGATSTFVIPSRYARRIGLGGEPVIRTELAYFRDEPRFRQLNVDPFLIAAQPECLRAPIGTECSGGRRLGDSWNFVLGIDMNQFIRPLNPRQSFFISTQFFYKHLKGAAKRQPISGFPAQVLDGEVLPVPEFFLQGTGQPVFIHHPVDQFLQTLLVSTSYFSGQVSPSLLMLYDWSGGFVVAPGVQFIRDPFRFSMSYNYLEASRLKGASGVSLLRDRDNILFQFEYVI
jgi:hypothetical protein